MTAAQRRKGQAGEREAYAYLRERLGDKVQRRNLAQPRDGGADLRIGGRVAVEVKRRRHIAVYPWLAQAKAAAAAGELPVVIARADGESWVAILDADEFSKLLQRVLLSA